MVYSTKLRVVLTADDVIVAETDDTLLWQEVLLAIQASLLDRDR